MTRSCRWRYVQLIMTFTAGFLLLASSLFGQTQTGNLFGTVVDNGGEPLPGVTITVNSGGFQQTFVTEPNGSFRFLRLVPGNYKLTAELEGFSAYTRTVDVNLGGNAEIKVKLVPRMSETITVTAATPLVDTRESGTSSVITQQELEQLPTARDPWVMLQQTPGVLVDRVNVGGNKSGQQSYFVSKGVERGSTAWNIDGVNVTEMDETGTTTFYYDFGSLQEFQVVTATSDPSVRTPGAQVNMVTKRGTNELSGSARYFYTDESLQANATMPNSLREGNKIDNVTEYGGDVGGAIVRDKIWYYGAFSKNNISNITASYNFPQKTELTNWTAKFTAQPTANNNANVYYMFSDKTVNARDLSITRPPETARKQSGPGWVAKAEDTHMFSSNFSVTGMYAHVDSGYKQEPRGGMETEPYWVDYTDYCNTPGQDPSTCYGWHRTYRLSQQWLTQDNLRADGSSFFTTGNVDHEMTWGVGYRTAPSEWLLHYPGNETWAEFYAPGDGDLAAFTRDGHSIYTAAYKDLYVGDRVLLGNLTLQGGLRYDMQQAWNKASSVAANPLIPNILTAATFAGDKKKLEWNSLAPRISASYALGGAKQTVLRGSYNRYADQLGSSSVGAGNPFYSYQVLYYNWKDLNGDKRVQTNEVDFSEIYNWSNIDPNNLSAGGVSAGRIDYNMKPTTTDEFLLGVQHEFTPGFAMGLSYTYRLRQNFVWDEYEKTQGKGDFYTPADYVLASAPFAGVMPDGSAYSIPYYQLKSGVPRPTYYVTRNRPDYEQHYQGLELTAEKRMSNRWEMRGQLTLSDWTQKVGKGAIQNPSPLLQGDGCYTCDGGAVASNGGSDGYINSRWAYSLTGLYQAPWNVMFGAVMSGREGYINGYNIRQRVDRVQTRYVINKFEDYRFPNLFQLDLRAAKQFAMTAGTGLELAIDAFNVTNGRTILWRDYTVPLRSTPPPETAILEMQSPRVFRINAKVTF